MAREIVEVPITGKVTNIAIKVGDMVQEGDILCLIESMKMENPISSPVTGKIIEIGVSVGQVVATGNLIAAIEY